MPTVLGSNTVKYYRGGTIQFVTTFFDFNNNVTQPDSAVMNVVYFNDDGSTATLPISMTGPTSPAVTWTALWDTRNVAPGAVFWSVHSVTAGIPRAVEDGNFTLQANDANLENFA